MPGLTYSSGTYYPDTASGNVFIGSTAVAGTTFPLSTGTAMTFGLWNTSTTKNAVLLRFTAGFTSGTIALGEVGLTNIQGGYSVATSGNITAFTDGVVGTTIRNGIIGGGNASAMRFTPSAATVVAGTACYWMGASQTSATGAQPATLIDHDFKGHVIVPPGMAVFVVGSIAQTALYTMSLVWAEVNL